MKNSQQTEQNTQKQKSVNKIDRVLNTAIALVIIAILAVSSFGIYVYARYRESLQGTGSAQVAKWYFDLKNGSGTSVQTGNVSFPITRTDGRTHVVEGKLAPGTYGEFEMQIDTRTTEVDLTYEISIELTHCPQNLKFYRDSDRIVELEKQHNSTTGTDTIVLKKYLIHEQAYTYYQTVKIYWEWPYESGELESDLQDTEDAQYDMTMNITATATEVLGAPTGTVDYLDLGSNYKVSVEVGEQVPVAISTGFTSFENITYTSDNTSIATVDTTSGVKITGVTAGKTTITMTGATSGKTQKIYVTVSNPEYEITLDNQSATSAGTAKIYETRTEKFSLTSGGDAMTTSANPITVPTKTNYNFNGYYTGASGAGTKYIDENGYLTSSASNTNFSANGTLYAYWTLAGYQVTFDAATNGGTVGGESTTSVIVPIGSTLGDVLDGNLPTAVHNTKTFLGWYTSSSGGTKVTTATEPGETGIIYYAQYGVTGSSITPANNYGNTVNYSVTTNGVTLDNWKIFLKTTEGNQDYVYMIYGDYLPNAAISQTAKTDKSLETGGTYRVWGNSSNSNRTKFIEAMTTTSYWNHILTSDLISKGATATGAPTVTQFKASWNGLYTSSQDQVTVTGNESSGWSTQSLSSTAGYAVAEANNLYFPHKSYWTDGGSNITGYWLASPNSGGTNLVMAVNYNGPLGSGNFYTTYRGFRPLVKLPSNILVQNSNGTWDIQ